MKIEWMEPAKRQVQEIFDYHLSVAGTRTARKIVNRIIERPRILANNPHAGEREWLLEDAPYEYRRLVADDHKIIYRIDGDTVWIVDVWDCRRNPSTLRRSVLRRRS